MKKEIKLSEEETKLFAKYSELLELDANGTEKSLDDESRAKNGYRIAEEKLNSNGDYIAGLEKEFNRIYGLDKTDYLICAFASVLSSVVDIFLVGIPTKNYDGIDGAPLAKYVRDKFNKWLPEDEMKKLANQKISKVPYDAQDNRNTTMYVEGLSAYYHRMLELGHDPILGFFVGVYDILHGTMTTIDKKGNFISQEMSNYAERKEELLFVAIVKQFCHLMSDATTSMGLPVPLMSLFNFLQIGKFGDEEQTIAEIVQGMYYEGYDFIHFCAMSIPTMIVEVVVRVAYALKSLSSGATIRESIPVAIGENKNKLETMLFLAHAGATAINCGRVVFTRNPLVINYPQWLKFSKYALGQIGVQKSKKNRKEQYVKERIEERINCACAKINNLKECSEYIFVM